MEELDSVFWIKTDGVFYGKPIEEIAYFKSMWPWVKWCRYSGKQEK